MEQPVAQQHEDCGNLYGMNQIEKPCCSRDKQNLSSKGFDAWA